MASRCPILSRLALALFVSAANASCAMLFEPPPVPSPALGRTWQPSSQTRPMFQARIAPIVAADAAIAIDEHDWLDVPIGMLANHGLFVYPTLHDADEPFAAAISTYEMSEQVPTHAHDAASANDGGNQCLLCRALDRSATHAGTTGFDGWEGEWERYWWSRRPGATRFASASGASANAASAPSVNPTASRERHGSSFSSKPRRWFPPANVARTRMIFP